jgi:hypothetical protein
MGDQNTTQPKPTPEEAGALARLDYEQKCLKFGRPIDPITADDEYWRAYRIARGRTHRPGD